LTNTDCVQCLLAFSMYYDAAEEEIPTDGAGFVSAVTSFCVSGDGPPASLTVAPLERKLELSNVCSGTDTDLETVSLTFVAVAFSAFPTEAIVPPAPTAAPSAAPTVTTGTTTTGTTTTGTTTGTSSAVHLSIGSWTLLLAFVGIWA